mmetsp:Transcript_7013/g.6197  ORF Transcript_7013/g.6197 Transcript_7013/m.6197 type:complete len:168 (-) Transcript_7013:371-874(-)
MFIDLSIVEMEFYKYLITPYVDQEFGFNDHSQRFLLSRIHVIGYLVCSDNNEHLMKLITCNLLWFLDQIIGSSENDEDLHSDFHYRITEFKTEALYIFSNVLLSDNNQKEHILSSRYGENIVRNILKNIENLNSKIRKVAFEAIEAIVFECKDQYIEWLVQADIFKG